MNASLGMLVATYDRQTKDVGLGDWWDTASDALQNVTKAAGQALAHEISPGTTQQNLNQFPQAPKSATPWPLIIGGVAVVGGLWWFLGRRKTA